jgi:pyrimidine-specific ribonucleoside hydrolase
MKRKQLLFGILGLLVLLVVLIGPGAPLLSRMGIEPVCIQGDFPDLKVVACPSTAPTPLPLQSLEGRAPIPLIFDDDGSPDGTLALLFFLSNPLYDVKAVTVSPGEAHPEIFAGHLTRLLASLGRTDILVGYGRQEPLEGNNSFPEPWRETSDAFWDIPLPDAPGSLKPLPAVELIVDTLKRSAQPVSIFVSGTHTNLAEALRLDAHIRERIEVVYVMGGSINVPGNIESDWPEINNQVSEWNIWVDPVAAREVFASGIRLVIMPLDGTNRVTWGQMDAEKWTSMGTAAGRLSAGLLRWMLSGWSTDSAYIWDLAAAATLTDPRLCQQQSLALDILVEAGPEQGRTVIVDGAPNARVCFDPDVQQVKMRVEKILASSP